jgi:hypothetical protein
MKRFATLFVLLVTPMFSQTTGLQILSTFPGPMVINIGVQGPPNTPFTLYYVIGNIYYPPIPVVGELFSAQTNQNGIFQTQMPFQTPVPLTVAEAQVAAVFFPPAAPPVVTEIVSLSLTSAPPVVPCGPSIGTLTYEPGPPCIVSASVKVCPGDFFEIKKNGATIGSGTGPTSGQVSVNVGMCLAPGDEITGVVNGVQVLGPVRR